VEEKMALLKIKVLSASSRLGDEAYGSTVWKVRVGGGLWWGSGELRGASEIREVGMGISETLQ
jgi:hypothetical protein